MSSQETLPAAFEQLCQFTRETALLASVESLLTWDERTLMPPAASEYRAEQVTFLSGLLHQRRTDPRLGQWLGELRASGWNPPPHSDAEATIRELQREFDKRCKLPQSLVEELARTAVLGQQAWVEARKHNDFDEFRPWLEKTYELKRQQAAAMGYAEQPYDALLDDFEPNAKTAAVSRVLAGLREDLSPLVAAIADSGKTPPIEILRRRYPAAAQEAFGKHAAAAIGFDFRRGRLDVTHHPFCAGMGPHDCRITTRYDEKFFPSAFFGILHEAGHGIYDQGLRTDQYGLPPGSYVSLGIHESQSRMWENFVGRSRGFWRHFFPLAQRAFPEALAGVNQDDWCFALNAVKPSLIRVEADEATYNLHIIIRFELEQALLSGDLPVSDLPAVWREKYRAYLGIEPPNDADGVLQDIHWSAGLIGYFPTYSLGNLYASQLFAAAQAELGDLESQFAAGEFAPLRGWLQQNIHERGQCYPAAELAELVTSQPLTHQPLIDHLRNKLAPLYDL